MRYSTSPLRSSLVLLALIALGGVGCAGSAEIITPSTLPAVQVNGEDRLAAGVRPVGYELTLEIDPDQEVFRGTTTIDIELEAQTSELRLHAEGLTITGGLARAGDGGPDIQVQTTEGENGGLGVAFGAPVGPGRVRLTLDYTAALDEVPVSLYRVKADNGLWYAFTQFEPLEARAAFPCFDEPGFKTPFRVTLKVPGRMVAAANTPIEDRQDDGTTATVRFVESRPMPTYLVAFAVGEFDVVEGPAVEGQPPLRILATKGNGKLAQYALKHTPTILKTLSDYFGMPYPYRKLDMVAVPNFSAGAMENVGLVTYRETLLLVDPDNSTAGQLRGSLSVIAHELAHMWFGNLVTMAWWDDLWLNEAFATWMASYVMTRAFPEFEEPLRAVASKGGIMQADAQDTARPIKKTIHDSGDIRNAFDGITYAKGAAVLRMLEAWMGEGAFRDGLRLYMKRHAWGNATEADLLAALAETSGKPVADTARAFVQQPGAPLVTATLTCDDKKPALHLAQSRYRPRGASAPDGDLWRIPVCVHYDGGKAVEHQCFLLDAKEATFPLNTASCPAWIYPNADELGYYRWTLPGDGFLALASGKASLNTHERLALTNHAQALLESGALPGGTYIQILQSLSSETHPLVVDGLLGATGLLWRAVEDRDRPRYATLVRQLFADDAARVGLTPPSSSAAAEDVNVRALRGPLFETLARLGEDVPTRTQLKTIANAWLKDPGQHPIELAGLAIPVAAREGDAAMFDALLNRLKVASTPVERNVILSGLGSFSDPALIQRALGLYLDGTARSQDWWALAGPTWRDPQTFQVFWTWFTTHYDQIVAIRGPKSAAGLPFSATGFCDAQGRQTAADFFSKATLPPGADDNLNQALEAVDRCIRLREGAGPSIAEALPK